MMLIINLVETGKLIGYLEWAMPVIQDCGAEFYMMCVCPSHQTVTLEYCTNFCGCSTVTSTEFCTTLLHEQGLM
jgi:hypothetical protein